VPSVVSLLHSLRFMVRSRAALHLEIIALRHQLAVVNRSRRPRLRFTSADRMLWAWRSQAWCGWRSAVHIVRPDTVIAWHRRGDHVIVANETGLRRVLRDYLTYYLHSRTHLALDKDTPISRSVAPPSAGRVVATPQVGGLHHRYDRVAA
jgi:hypothetical protein